MDDALTTIKEALRFAISQNDLPALIETLYRIVQELLQNIIKHAKVKEILFQLIEANHKLILMVEDDGVALPDDIQDRPVLGMCNQKSRIDLLNAKLILSQKGR